MEPCHPGGHKVNKSEFEAPNCSNALECEEYPCMN